VELAWLSSSAFANLSNKDAIHCMGVDIASVVIYDDKLLRGLVESNSPWAFKCPKLLDEIASLPVQQSDLAIVAGNVYTNASL